MPAPVSSSAGQFSLAGALFASTAQVGLKGGSVKADAFSFSSTLQSRLDSPPQGRAPGAHLDNVGRTREPERAAQPERAREPERQEGNKPAEGTGDSAKQRDGASREAAETSSQQDGRPAGAGSERTSSSKAAEDGANAPADRSNSAGDNPATAADGVADAASAAGATGSAELTALVASNLIAAAPGLDGTIADAAAETTDTDNDAGLPADLAALLPQLAASQPASGAGGLDPAADDSLGKSLQNSGLLPRMETGAQGMERGVANAMLLLQAREGAAAGRLAGGAQSMEGSGPASTSPLPGSTAPHQLSEFAALRGQAIAARPTVPQLPVGTPVGQDGWAEDVGNRVTWMLGRAESKAELVLTPPNLGKLEVSINLNGDQTTAQFIAASQAARNAIEQALPRLREVLAEAGISLGETSVSTSGEHQAGRDDGSGGRGRGHGGGAVAGSAATNWLRQHDGMVDTFV